MKYRIMGKTGYNVSEIGYGAWGIGGDWWKGGSDDEALKGLHKAIDLGVNFIDTALGYGNGHSEQLIGKVLKERSERIYVATKIPRKDVMRPVEPGTPISGAYPKDWIIECTEKSLKNLGLEKIDIQMFHFWTNEWINDDGWKEAAALLKEQGKIGAFGASINFPYNNIDNGIPAMESGHFDVCEVVYNIYQQEPEEDIFKTALKNNVGIIARCPLDEGSLSGKITPDSVFPDGSFQDYYFRDDRKQEVYDKANELQWLINEGYASSLPEAALRFPLNQEAVSTIIVGMRNEKHVDSNCQASDKGTLPQEVIQRLKAHKWAHDYWA